MNWQCYQLLFKPTIKCGISEGEEKLIGPYFTHLNEAKPPLCRYSCPWWRLLGWDSCSGVCSCPPLSFMFPCMILLTSCMIWNTENQKNLLGLTMRASRLVQRSSLQVCMARRNQSPTHSDLQWCNALFLNPVLGNPQKVHILLPSNSQHNCARYSVFLNV